MKRIKRARKNKLRRPNCIARAHRPPGSLRPVGRSSG